MGHQEATAEVPRPDLDDAQWRALVDQARDPYISIDAQGTVTEWNREAANVFGWRRDETVGRLLADLIVPPEYRDAHLLGVRRFVATGEGSAVLRRLRLPALHRSGRRLEIELTIWPSRDPDGDWQFHAFLHDLTGELRQASYLRLLQQATVAANEATTAEAAVRATLEALREATEVPLAHAYLVDDHDGGDVRVEPSGWWSPGPREPFSGVTAGTTFRLGEGLPGRVVASKRPTWLPDIAEDTNFPRAPEALACGLGAAFGFPIVSGDRVVAVIEMFAEEPGEPNTQLVDVMETVGTQLGRVFEREAAITSLRELADDREAIVSIVGHELRGPLTAAHIAVGLLADHLHEVGVPEGDEMVGLLDRQLGRVRRLVDDLLTAQRLGTGGLRTRPEAVDVARVAREVADDADLRDVEVTLPEDVRVWVDPDHLAQMFWNLLSNAATHGEPPIVIGATRTEDLVVLQVRDAGTGVPPELVPELFQRFARGATSRGSGLGLAIIRGLARANGGDATYRPDDHAFVVTLPAA